MFYVIAFLCGALIDAVLSDSPAAGFWMFWLLVVLAALAGKAWL